MAPPYFLIIAKPFILVNIIYFIYKKIGKSSFFSNNKDGGGRIIEDCFTGRS